MASLPSVHGVRVATQDDLHRISTVAAAAFFSSPTFQFQRPLHHRFSSDTIASYFMQYDAAIRDPLCLVLVAEDTLEADEAKHVYEALRGAFSSQPSDCQAIVGVCSIQLKPNSSYVDHLQQRPTLASPATNQPGVNDLQRDQSAEAVAIYNQVTRPAKLKCVSPIPFPNVMLTTNHRYLDGNMRLSTLAVAPAYWRRGHARRLVSFCTQLADLDNAVLGVSATPYGAKVVSKAGFQEQDVIRYTPLTIGQQLQQGAISAAGFELWYSMPHPGGHAFLGESDNLAVSTIIGIPSAVILDNEQSQGVMRDDLHDKLIGTDYLLALAAFFQVRQGRIDLVQKRKA
ncbi:Acetyltransf-1 domain containing protein [Pyrenophora teres f. teres]|uniref:Acetyltransf-1 domain containing protein n=1 Tax=Pyrenophora teres f. teres TaxID=97479 RepID=A0A6S6VXG3_9PLEO|nr:Acetyltransf-1 domain containing protein [Pyrenophora teres f. teres]